MDAMSAIPVLRALKLGAYILREPSVSVVINLVKGADGTVIADLTGRSDIIEDLLAANYIALSNEPGPSIGAEIYRVTGEGLRAR